MNTPMKGLQQHSEEMEEMLGQTPNGVARWGLTVIAACMALLFTGSWFLGWPRQMRVGGSLVTDGRESTMEVYLTAGQVRQLNRGMTMHITLDIKDDSWGYYEACIGELPLERDSTGAYPLQIALPENAVTNRGHSLGELLTPASCKSAHLDATATISLNNSAFF